MANLNFQGAIIKFINELEEEAEVIHGSAMSLIDQTQDHNESTVEGAAEINQMMRMVAEYESQEEILNDVIERLKSILTRKRPAKNAA